MERDTYLRFLRALLMNRVPAAEAEDIVRFYTEYLEEAGPEGEKEAMAALGNPEELTGKIMAQREREDREAAGDRARGSLHSMRAKAALAGACAAAVVAFVLFRRASGLWNAVRGQRNYVAETALQEIAFVSSEALSDGYAYYWTKGLEALSQVQVDIDLGDVMIYSVDQGGDARIDLSWESDSYTLQCELVDSVLRIWSEGNAGTEELDAQVYLTLPEGVLEEALIHTDWGNVEWYSGEAEHVALSSDLGDITWLSESVVSRAELTSGMGNVLVSGMQCAELKASSAGGDVTLELSGVDNLGYELSTQMGQVTVNGLEQGRSAKAISDGQMNFVIGKTSMGDVWLDY